MPKIENPEDFRAWLEGKPAELAAVLASRMALRVLPMGFRVFRSTYLTKADLHEALLSLMRTNLIARAVRHYASPDDAFTAMKNAAIASAKTSRRIGSVDHVNAENIENSISAAFNLRYSLLSSSVSATAASTAIFRDQTAAFDAAIICLEHSNIVMESTYVNLNNDCNLSDKFEKCIDSVENLYHAPLFLGEKWPTAFSIAYAKAKIVWNSDKGSWGAWADWYDRVLDGSSSEWGLNANGEMLMARRIVALPDTSWNLGASHINAMLEVWLNELASAAPQPTPDADRYDYFISYAHADDAAAREVAHVLEANGFSSFAMFKDIGPGNFVTEMTRGLAGSKGFLPLYSEAYFKSEHCTAEWNTAYNRDPSGKNRIIRAFMLQPCEVPPLARQLVYKQLSGLSPDARRQAILEWVRWQPPSLSADEIAEAARRIASPQPVITPGGKIAMAPNAVYDRSVNPQDLLDPIRQMLLLLRATMPYLEGNQFRFLRNNLGEYQSDLADHGAGACWGALDRLMRNVETSFRHMDPREFDPGLAAQFEDLFKLHGKCTGSLQAADERLRDLHDVQVNEMATGADIGDPVDAIRNAAQTLEEAGLTEASFDQGMQQIVDMGREQQAAPPPPVDAAPQAVSGRKAWVIGALGISKETLYVLGSTASLVALPAVQVAIQQLELAIAALSRLLW